MKQKATPAFIIGMVALGCLLMYGVEVWQHPVYFTKSLLKLLVFGGLPLLCPVPGGRAGLLAGIFRPRQKKQLLRWAVVGAAVYLLILGAYGLLRPLIDLDHIAAQLGGTLGVTGSNFIYVALYISVINSLLEEFFFRGFAFLTLKKQLPAKAAHLFSALAFALYHLAILSGWFSPLLFAAAIAGLCLAGVFFNLLDGLGGSIYPSWMVHLCANLAINTIGLAMFGLI